MSALESLQADALPALPRHESSRLAIRALVAPQNWAPLAFVPLWAWRLAHRPLFTAMNGQFLAIRAAAYDRAGGFAAIRASLGEDVALGRCAGRRLAATGHTVALVPTPQATRLSRRACYKICGIGAPCGSCYPLVPIDGPLRKARAEGEVEAPALIAPRSSMPQGGGGAVGRP